MRGLRRRLDKIEAAIAPKYSGPSVAEILDRAWQSSSEPKPPPTLDELTDEVTELQRSERGRAMLRGMVRGDLLSIPTGERDAYYARLREVGAGWLVDYHKRWIEEEKTWARPRL